MIRLDPRTKILLLLIIGLYSAFADTGDSLPIIIGVILITGVLLGRVWKTIRSGLIFYATWLFALYILPNLGGVLHTSLLAWFGLVFKCYPCCMLAGVVMGTTHISEFMAGMSKMRVPREIFIPIAIMFRYFPVVKNDWAHIKDAMALRGLTPTPAGFVRKPAAVVGALYVPMLVSASKTADELSVAAITRGIENPGIRSSRLKIKMGLWDVCFIISYIALLVFGIKG